MTKRTLWKTSKNLEDFVYISLKHVQGILLTDTITWTSSILYAMHLSSDSERFFVRDGLIGWRYHFDFSNYTHVRTTYINIEPSYQQLKRKICNVYCNIVSKSITDPNGTLVTIGAQLYLQPETGLFRINHDDSLVLYIYP